MLKINIKHNSLIGQMFSELMTKTLAEFIIWRHFQLELDNDINVSWDF